MPASHPQHHRLTLADYFSHEKLSPAKHEFADGQIFVMAGGSPRHGFLSLQVQRLLPTGADGPCAAFPSDLRISTPDGLYSYSDGSVFCGDMITGPEQTATNPVLLLEVISDSTRSYDRGEKLERYKSIPTLRHVLLIEQDAVDVEVWTRGEDGWTRAVFVDAGDNISLPAIDTEIQVADIYANSERFSAT